MALFGNFLLRIISISFGVLLALIAVGIFIGFGIYNEAMIATPLVEPWEEDIFAIISMGVGLYSTMLIGSYGIGVIAIAIAISEMMRWQSMVSNVVLGGACAAFLAMTIFDKPISGTVTHDGGSLSNGNYGPLLVALSAGFIGGFIYWLIAGRRAGDWLGGSKISVASSKS